MQRAHTVLAKILEDADPEDTRYDEKGRMVRMGTTKRDRAAIVRDTLASMKTLGEISRDATEQRIAVTKLLAGVFSAGQSGNAPTAPTITIVYPTVGAPSAEQGTSTSAEPPPSGGTPDDRS
jgi:hypothetical protein